MILPPRKTEKPNKMEILIRVSHFFSEVNKFLHISLFYIFTTTRTPGQSRCIDKIPLNENFNDLVRFYLINVNALNKSGLYYSILYKNYYLNYKSNQSLWIGCISHNKMKTLSRNWKTHLFKTCWQEFIL